MRGAGWLCGVRVPDSELGSCLGRQGTRPAPLFVKDLISFECAMRTEMGKGSRTKEEDWK